ncbi:MBL fold metallo-hydrolase [Hydrogenimonas cancrithermarum]|uniref:Zn-dependent hydrolase glyoxylase n=1 Tax=Hydrogenimonas cancrithermarum TaxID=2993563 RepID=A0ABM8FLL9_9BACT|nr:MBL fold metallo-hydrolase [Hydrogenimonas cancrithermarum]BDY12610.1 Zn-dependent hydrolase glyoxylase [Hydrogenimonas cancrithermarum]
MKKSLLLLFVSCMTLWAQGYGLSPKQVAPKLYCFFGAVQVPNAENNGNMVNTCYIDAGSGWIVFDSGPTYRYAKEAYETMHNVKPQPILAVFNSHVHDDHWLGNGFYHALGVTIYGPKNFSAEHLATPTRIETTVKPSFYKGTVPVAPDRLVSAPTTMKIGDLTLWLLVFGRPAHTSCDMALFVSDERLLLAGDLVFNDRLPSLRDGSLSGWLDALERLKKMRWDVLVGGHGYKTGEDAMVFIEAYLGGLHSQVKAAMEEDVEMGEIVQSVGMPEFRDMALYDVLHGKNVIKAYEELEWESE